MTFKNDQHPDPHWFGSWIPIRIEIKSWIQISIETSVDPQHCQGDQLQIHKQRHSLSVRLSGNQCCGSGMFIPDPGSWFLPIPDPGSKTATKERGEKKLDVKPFYLATKFNKIVNYFSFEVLKKKIWANFQRILELFTKKIDKKLFKKWSWDPGSGKNPFRIPDPGSRGQKGTGFRIRNTAGNTARNF